MAADPGQLTWKCYDCNMTFGNPSLLQKHKARFCVGGQLGDPELLLLRKGLRTEDPPPPRQPPEDYERAREGGKRPNPVTFAHQRRSRKPYLSENDVPRYNPHHDPKVKQLAETHGRQMESLHNKNRDLERQREEIRRRLEELGRKPQEKDNSSEEMLRELREQEARNQRLLNELRLQLADARRPVNVHEQPEKKTFIYPVYYGNSLVAEIVAVRQAYLQNGGNEPDILAQLAQMQAEAQAIDDSMRNAQKRQPKDRKDGSSNIMGMELENERLQRQLLLLQEQKIISTNRRKDNREGRTAPALTLRPTQSQKPPTTRQSVSKWVQTNPVPSDEAEASALPPGNDYEGQRQHAKLALEDRWGPSRAQPTARPGQDPRQTSSTAAQTQPQGRGRRVGRAGIAPWAHSQQPEATTYESLQPDRLDTIEEAANVDDYDPDQPLDIDLSAIPPRSKKNRVLFPYKPNIGPQLNTSRSVIVRSEKPYGLVDFYGRPVDENGRLIQTDRQDRQIEDLEKRARQSKLQMRENRFPYYKSYLTGQRLLIYENLLRDMFKKSDDLIRYDPYYSSVYSKRKRYTTYPEDTEEEPEYTPRQPTNPPLLLEDATPDDGPQVDPPVPGTSSNAEVQTDPNDLRDARPSGNARPPPPSQQPAEAEPGTSGTGRGGAGNPKSRGVDAKQADTKGEGKGTGDASKSA